MIRVWSMGDVVRGRVNVPWPVVYIGTGIPYN